jgi:hypothetical protein
MSLCWLAGAECPCCVPAKGLVRQGLRAFGRQRADGVPGIVEPDVTAWSAYR